MSYALFLSQILTHFSFCVLCKNKSLAGLEKMMASKMTTNSSLSLPKT